MKTNFTPAHKLHVLEKREKVKEIGRLQNRFLKFVQELENAKRCKSAKPTFVFSKTERILMLEIFVISKEAVKGIQMEIFPIETTETPQNE